MSGGAENINEAETVPAYIQYHGWKRQPLSEPEGPTSKDAAGSCPTILYSDCFLLKSVSCIRCTFVFSVYIFIISTEILKSTYNL